MTSSQNGRHLETMKKFNNHKFIKFVNHLKSSANINTYKTNLPLLFSEKYLLQMLK